MLAGLTKNHIKDAKCICPNKSVELIDCPAHRRYSCVAIYPKAIYIIEDTDKWVDDAIPENCIQ